VRSPDQGVPAVLLVSVIVVSADHCGWDWQQHCRRAIRCYLFALPYSIDPLEFQSFAVHKGAAQKGYPLLSLTRDAG
jgi:hypothetical protein